MFRFIYYCIFYKSWLSNIQDNLIWRRRILNPGRRRRPLSILVYIQQSCSVENKVLLRVGRADEGNNSVVVVSLCQCSQQLACQQHLIHTSEALATKRPFYYWERVSAVTRTHVCRACLVWSADGTRHCQLLRKKCESRRYTYAAVAFRVCTAEM